MTRTMRKTIHVEDDDERMEDDARMCGCYGRVCERSKTRLAELIAEWDRQHRWFLAQQKTGAVLA